MARFFGQLNVRIPMDVYQDIQQLAAKHGGTLVGAVIAAVDALKREDARRSAQNVPRTAAPEPAEPLIPRPNRKSGIPAYGWHDVDGERIEHPEEQRARLLIIERAREGKSQAAIRDELNAGGMQMRDGKPWTSKGVDKVIRHATTHGELPPKSVKSE